MVVTFLPLSSSVMMEKALPQWQAGNVAVVTASAIHIIFFMAEYFMVDNQSVGYLLCKDTIFVL
jgi:hypothetical protein